MSQNVYVCTKERGQVAWRATRRALARVGATAIRIKPTVSADFDGPLVLSGGAHVHPRRYGEAPLEPASSYDERRDAVEFAHLARIERRGQRVLGICRGMQLLVVAAGGTLHQDVWAAAERPRPRRTIFPRRLVHIEGDSMLAELLGTTQLRVNSLHTQGVKELPDGLRAVAWDDDGVVQAVEGHNVIGVQWHPEYLARSPQHRRLFNWVARTHPAPERLPRARMLPA